MARKVSWFNVDVDESPERRWLHIIREFEPQLAKIRDDTLTFFANKIRPHLREHNIATMEDFYNMAYERLPSSLRSEHCGLREPRIGL